MLRKFSCGYAAGTVGALIACTVLWLLAREGIIAWMGVSFRPGMNRSWLISNLFWGGLFGLPLTLPVLANRVALRGLLFSLLPAIYTLMVFFPRTGKNILGINHGPLTPALLLTVFALWGLTAAGWYRYAR